MKILVTGANGFVGQCLRPTLIAHGHSIATFSRHPIQNIKTIPFDINYTNIVDEDIKKYEVLIHLAGRAHVMHETEQDVYQAYKEVNVDYTLKVAKHAHDSGVKRFVFLSSIKVNGEHTSAAFNEENTPNPQDAYGQTKLEAEEALKAFCQSHGMEYVIIRPPLIYGLGVKANFKALIKLCQLPIPLPLGKVENKRSFVGLDNLCDFILLCCKHPKAANQTFLISDDEDVSTTELISTIRQALGKKPWLMPIASRYLDQLFKLLGKASYSERLLGNLQVDITKAKNLLGWQPPYTVEQGIQKTVAAYLESKQKYLILL